MTRAVSALLVLVADIDGAVKDSGEPNWDTLTDEQWVESLPSGQRTRVKLGFSVYNGELNRALGMLDREGVEAFIEAVEIAVDMPEMI